MEGKTNSFESLGKWDPSVYFASPARRIAFILPSFSSLFLVRSSIDISRFFAALCSLCLISVKILLRDRIPFNIKKLKSVPSRRNSDDELEKCFFDGEIELFYRGANNFSNERKKIKSYLGEIWESTYGIFRFRVFRAKETARHFSTNDNQRYYYTRYFFY